MELRDYLRMLRRGWPVVVLITALFVALSALYLTLTPKVYESTAVLLVSAGNAEDTNDLTQGANFAGSAVTSYAKVVDSSTVLGPVAAQLQPRRDVVDLIDKISATVPEDTRLIQVTAVGNNAGEAATLANATASSASQILPTLENLAELYPVVRVTQIVQANEASGPVSPSTKRVLALGFVIGLCVGLGVIIAAQTIDTRLRQVDDVRALTDIPLLAVLPKVKRSQKHGLVARDEPSGEIGEAFRTLRTNLRFLEAKDRRSMVFTALSDDREAAQVPANLAWSLVQAGWRVLLVDLDLRRSTVADAFALRATPGLADVLMRQAQLNDVVRDTNHTRFKIVVSGTPQVTPADLLSAPAMVNVLRRMEQSFDYVILHAPPLLSYTDAALVSDAAGGTLLTIAAGRTRAQDLTTALGTLANVRVKPLGVVLTGARQSGRPGGRATSRLMAGVIRRRAPVAPRVSVAAPELLPNASNGSPQRPATPRPDLDPPTLRHHPAQPPKRPVPRSLRADPPLTNGNAQPPSRTSSRPAARVAVADPGRSPDEPRPTPSRSGSIPAEPAPPFEPEPPSPFERGPDSGKPRVFVEPTSATPEPAAPADPEHASVEPMPTPTDASTAAEPVSSAPDRGPADLPTEVGPQSTPERTEET
jgi:polysaccharide biosynthesis transport protein